MSNNFKSLVSIASDIRSFSPADHHDQFFKQEVLRFITVAGTVKESFPNVATSIDQRIVSHILLRPIIENFFKIIYIYENPAQSSVCFEEILNGFKRDYTKLLNEPDLPMKDQLEVADPAWSSLPKPMDLRSMLSQIRNSQGNRLDFIYFMYRIASFDTHGNSMNALFEASFNKECNFPVLNIDPVLELIADEYLTTYNKIK